MGAIEMAVGADVIKRDYYEVLSVTRTASGDEIKKSYRRLAMSYHPDRNPGDDEAAEKFKEATEAHEILSDDQKRTLYDRHGHAAFQGGGGGAGNVNVDLGDLFGDLLGGLFGGGGGGRRSRPGPQRGQDVQAIIDIELADAATGVKKQVTIKREDICDVCGGNGAKAGTKPVACKRCGGQGVTLLKQGFFHVQQPCRSCNGVGQIVADPCQGCRGHGRVVGTRAVDVELPPGIDTGDRLRYQNMGDAGDAGAPRGDLEFAVRVREHKFFQRDGSNLICQWPVTFAQAALGAAIEITTLVGEKVKYDLPRGIQSHEVLRLAGHGLPSRRGGRKGDLLIQVILDTPQQLSPEKEALYRKLMEFDVAERDAPPAKKSVFHKLKDWLTADEVSR